MSLEGSGPIDQEKACGKHCWDAQSRDCTCVCGGANHGYGEAAYRNQSTLFSLANTSSIDTFFADTSRRRSLQIVFGREWRDGRKNDLYELIWICTTGEMCSLNHSNNTIEILGVISDEQAARHMLSKWEMVIESINSLGWVRQQLSHVSI